MIVVYGSSLAPSVRKVLAFTAEKGLSAKHWPLAPHDASPAFKETSPFGHIPGFRDGPFMLSDSSAICHYLERKYPEPALFPSSAADYGRMVWFDQFADRFLGAAECNVVMNRVVKNLRGEPLDPAAVEQALTRDLPPLLDYLETEIDGPFLVGGALSLADLAIACPFASLAIADYVPDPGRWPRLHAYIGRILDRPSLASIHD
ncbi:MAG TPA: glutathione S-transferase family protein [Stellaceae bacterium]|nr:glutathione S-transferase family protein [Stellaceae bacterium]